MGVQAVWQSGCEKIVCALYRAWSYLGKTCPIEQATMNRFCETCLGFLSFFCFFFVGFGLLLIIKIIMLSIYENCQRRDLHRLLWAQMLGPLQIIANSGEWVVMDDDSNDLKNGRQLINTNAAKYTKLEMMIIH